MYFLLIPSLLLSFCAAFVVLHWRRRAMLSAALALIIDSLILTQTVTSPRAFQAGVMIGIISMLGFVLAGALKSQKWTENR